MKKLGYVLLMVFGSVQLAAAQQTDKAKGFDPSRLFAGGNFGLSFGSGNSLINLSPQVGYHFSPQFAAGAGVSYIHYSYIDYADFKYSESYAGMNLFGRFYPIRQFFI
jgi:hypothetical protein